MQPYCVWVAEKAMPLTLIAITSQHYKTSMLYQPSFGEYELKYFVRYNRKILAPKQQVWALRFRSIKRVENLYMPAMLSPLQHVV